MRLFASASLWAIARLWYTLFAIVALAMIATAWRSDGGFRELFDMFRSTDPAGWLIIAALLAPGPLAHWLSVRVKQKAHEPKAEALSRRMK